MNKRLTKIVDAICHEVNKQLNELIPDDKVWVTRDNNSVIIINNNKLRERIDLSLATKIIVTRFEIMYFSTLIRKISNITLQDFAQNFKGIKLPVILDNNEIENKVLNYN